jgi:hypothetical protein
MVKEPKKLPESLPRETEAIPCPDCNGYCDKVPCTKDEIINQNCNIRQSEENRKTYECCIAAFVCRCCELKIIADLEAPEMECFD